MGQFIVYTFRENSTAITNHGTDGATYNGTANRNQYHMQANGYPYYGPFSGSGDMIAVPSSTNDNDPATRSHAFEFGFRYGGSHGSNGTYEKIWDKGLGGIYIGTIMQSGVPHVIVYFATTGTPVYWVSTSGYFSAYTNYYLQVSWSLPSTPGAATSGNVHVHCGVEQNAPTHIAMNFSGAGSGSWNSPNNNVTLFNYRAGGYNCGLYAYIVREVATYVNWDASSYDWAADKAYWTPTVDTSITCTVDNSTPIIGQTYHVTGVLQTVTGTKLAGKPIDVWYSTDNEGTWNVAYAYCTTDANGNYSYTQQGIASPGEWEYVVFEGDSNYNASNSGTPFHAVGQVINATAYPAVVSPECDVVNPSIDIPSIDVTAYPAVVAAECMPGSPGISLTIFPTVIGMEGNIVVAGVTIPGQAFPACLQPECDVLSPHVGITVFPSVVGIEGGVSPAPVVALGYTPAVVSSECAVVFPNVGFTVFPPVLEVEGAPPVTAFPPANAYIVLDIDQFAFPIAIVSECAPTNPATYIDSTVSTVVISPECAVVSPHAGIAVILTVIDVECAQLPAGSHIDAFVFPVRIQVEAEAKSMLVSLLSTQVLPHVLEPELGPSVNYAFAAVTQSADGQNIGAECGVLDPTVKIDNPTLIETDAILEEILETDAHIEDTIHIPITVTKDLELALEVISE